MRALGAMGNAAGFDDMPKQAEIGDIETHGLSFVFYEVCLPYNHDCTSEK
jgi:hypothetical protein